MNTAGAKPLGASPKTHIDPASLRLVASGPVRGMVPAVEVSGRQMENRTLKLIPWQQAAYRGKEHAPNPDRFGPGGVPHDVEQRMRESLPAPVRRTPQERLRHYVETLTKIGLPAYQRLGYPEWPASIAKRLGELGFKDKDTDFVGQVEALARDFLHEGSNKQRVADAKKVTLDWHGHYSV